MSIIPKELESFTADVLRLALKAKEDVEKTALAKEIESLQEQLLGKKSLLASLTGESLTFSSTPAKRGRKKGSKVAKGKKGKRTRDTGLKDTIVTFVKAAGAKGVHVDDIVKATGKAKANINAFLASTGKKVGIKGKGNRSGIYFLK